MTELRDVALVDDDDDENKQHSKLAITKAASSVSQRTSDSRLGSNVQNDDVDMVVEDDDNELEATRYSQMSEVNQVDTSNYSHQCYICDKVFSANSNLNRHLRKIHKENVQSPYNNVKCALCNSIYSSSSIYNQHLEKDHRVHIEVEHHTFDTKEQFEEWKHQIEDETTSQFIKSRGDKKSSKANKTYYSCNRSGYYVSKARTRKALKKQGSRKINGRCPAALNVTVKEDLSYDVRFVKTHVGHTFELEHLDLSDKDRELIVQKLISGVTKKDIIKQLRSSTALKPGTSGSTTPNGSLNNSVILAASGSPASTTISTTGNASEMIEVIMPVSSEDVLRLDSIALDSSAFETSVASTTDNSARTTPSMSTAPSSCLPTPANGCSNGRQLRSSRLHLATTKDIHNIINSKRLDSKLIKHNYDLHVLEHWVDDMQSLNNSASSVLFYKNQSGKSDRYTKLRSEDFLLAIMTEGQAEMLQRHGERCIIIDSTHNIHCEYLQVTLLAVVDAEGTGFPCAFMFSSRTDQDTLSVFFNLIKQKSGTIATRMVIADELDDFYQAWTQVMSRPTHNLLTPWCVFDNWAKEFESIKNKEKLRRLKKSLRALLTEPEADKFSRTLNQILTEFRDDEDVGKFVEYFERNYANNQDLWSSCLRKSHGVLNYQLSKLHDRFKLIYKAGKTSKKLCIFVAKMMTLFDDRQLDTVTRLEETLPQKKEAVEIRHNKSLESTNILAYEVAADPPYWLFPDGDNSKEEYHEIRRITNQRDASTKINQQQIVTRSSDASQQKLKVSSNLADIKPTPCCNLVCASCNACRHEYKCSCLDYVVNMNLCKHIHQICLSNQAANNRPVS